MTKTFFNYIVDNKARHSNFSNQTNSFFKGLQKCHKFENYFNKFGRM